MNQLEELDEATSERIEVEDNRRCADCGSTEAGNCFYCKAD